MRRHTSRPFKAPRHHHIQQHDVRLQIAGQQPTRVPSGGSMNLEIIKLQRHLEQFADVHVVFNDQDFFHGRSLSRT